MTRRDEHTFENTFGLPDSQLRIIVWGGAALLLLLPLVAMQFTQEVVWDGLDFLVFAVMLALAGGALEIGARLSRSLAYRVGYGLAVAAAFILVWANLAVGIIGPEDNPINLTYFGVIVLLVLGGLVVRGRPGGMALTMFAAAVVPILIALISLLAPFIGGEVLTIGSVVVIVLANGFFFTIFSAAGLLFWLVARSQRKS